MTRIFFQSTTTTKCKSLLFSFPFLLFITCLIRPLDAKVIDLDWSTRSGLFDNGYHTTTVFARLNDLLRFRCAPDLSFQIHMMKPLDALGCVVSSAEPKNELIGFCGPNTSDPRLALRPFVLVPGQPSFQAGEVYYFVAVGNNSRQSYSSELCDTYGMRIRVHVMARNSEIVVDRIEEETKKLLAREQQKSDLEMVKEYNRNLVKEQEKTPAATERTSDRGQEEEDKDSYEDNQSIRNKPHHRPKSHEYDYSGRGRIHSKPHRNPYSSGGGGSSREENEGDDDSGTYHFRPISSDPYSLPSRTIGYDYVIGYEDTSSSHRSIGSFKFLSISLFLLLLLRLFF